MADINEPLLKLLDGAGPQHIDKVTQKPQFSEGSDGALHTKIVDQNGNPISSSNKLQVADTDVKAELELIKQTQQQILQRLDNPIDTQLTGSRVEEHKRFVDFNVTAGNLVWIDTDINIDSYRQFTVGVECRNSHNFEIICRYHGTQAVLLDEIVINADNKIRDLSDFKNSRSPRISIRVRNKSDVDQMYNVFLFGVK